MKIPVRARVAIIILSGLALAVSLYIKVKVDAHHPLPGCGEDSCHKVLGSRWEQWGCFSVATLGIGGYLALIGASIVTGFRKFDNLRRLVWSLMVVEGIAGLGFIAWLVLLQWLVIKHFCVFCLTSHVFGVAAYITVVRWAPVWRSWNRPRLKLGGAAGIVLFAMIGVHILAVPSMMVVQAAEELEYADEHGSETLAGGLMQFGKQPESRTVRLLDGALNFDLFDVPVTGSRDASHVMLDLSDYCCPSCRTLHSRLSAYREKTGVDLAVVHLPVPMNVGCNPNVKRTPVGFEDACTYAKLSMAVNKADPSKFEIYHNFLMKGGWPPKVEEARRKAETLVGKAALDAAMQDPAVMKWINTGIGVQRYIKAKTLPRLITATEVISYSGGSRAAFEKMMERVLGLGDE